MKRILAPSLFALSCFASLLHAQQSTKAMVDDLREELRLAEKTSVLGLNIHDNADAEFWEVQLYDTNYKGNRRLVTRNDGKIASDLAGSASPFRGTDLTPLRDADYTLSVDDLRAKAKQLAEVSGVQPTSFRYMLWHPSDKPAARWHLYAFDGKTNLVGRVIMDAPEGKVLTAAWGEEAVTAAKSTRQGARSEFEAFGQDVERTFKEVGADMEEFFTGRRTIDKN